MRSVLRLIAARQDPWLDVKIGPKAAINTPSDRPLEFACERPESRLPVWREVGEPSAMENTYPRDEAERGLRMSVVRGQRDVFLSSRTYRQS